jgi:hypothetical protein
MLLCRATTARAVTIRGPSVDGTATALDPPVVAPLMRAGVVKKLPRGVGPMLLPLVMAGPPSVRVLGCCRCASPPAAIGWCTAMTLPSLSWLSEVVVVPRELLLLDASLPPAPGRAAEAAGAVLLRRVRGRVLL